MYEDNILDLQEQLDMLKPKLHRSLSQKNLPASRIFEALVHKPVVSVSRTYPVKIEITAKEPIQSRYSHAYSSTTSTLHFVEASLRNMTTGRSVRCTELLMDNVRESFQIEVHPFATYEVSVKLHQIHIPLDGRIYLGRSFNYICIRDHPVVFSIEELCHLERRARSFESQQSGDLQTTSYFYRNKSPEYFADIVEKHDGMMKPYIKDLNGDPKCPSNGCIYGLYFMGHPHGNSSTKPRSPFGSMRFIIPVHRLFNRNCNLYFSDFWCHYEPHWVSLVITHSGSEADVFCRQYLLKLNKYNNRYLELQSDDQVKISTSVKVEILYTEAIDIIVEQHSHGARMKPTGIRGRGQSKPLGMRKKSTCVICNL